MDELVDFARENGYVETVLGRRRYWDINSSNAVVRGASERNAVNNSYQGSAADIIKIAMINISKKFEELQCKSKCSFKLHDELVLIS
jgi:DNA polymerase-1